MFKKKFGKRKKGNRRRYAKRTRRYNNKPYTKISRQPVSDRYFTKMRYSENVQLTLSLPNVLYGYQYRSSIFDPDYTGSGHQPLWHDQFYLLYEKYRVYGVKYSITLKTGSAVDLTTIYVKYNQSSAQDTNQYTLRERGDGKGRILAGPQGAPTHFSGYMSVAKVFGLSKKEFIADDSFVSIQGDNPPKTAFLQIYGSTVGGSTLISASLDLVYYVEFMQRADVSGS